MIPQGVDDAFCEFLREPSAGIGRTVSFEKHHRSVLLECGFILKRSLLCPRMGRKSWVYLHSGFDTWMVVVKHRRLDGIRGREETDSEVAVSVLGPSSSFLSHRELWSLGMDLSLNSQTQLSFSTTQQHTRPTLGPHRAASGSGPCLQVRHRGGFAEF